MKEYVFEKGLSLPLCAVIDDNYVDYLTGQIIDNQNVLNFIKKGLKQKKLLIKEIKFVIYKVVNVVKKNDLVGYNYCINGCFNYLDKNRCLLLSTYQQIIRNKLMNGEFKQVLLWE